MNALKPSPWRPSWTHTLEKSPTNVTNLVLYQIMHAVWGHIWWHIVGRRQSNATNVTSETNASSETGTFESALGKHLNIHSGRKSNKCNQCDFASSHWGSQASSLRTHIKRHNATFHVANYLKRHWKIHSGEKSNKCNQCDLAYYHAYSLRRNLKTHTQSSLLCGNEIHLKPLCGECATCIYKTVQYSKKLQNCKVAKLS